MRLIFALVVLVFATGSVLAEDASSSVALTGLDGQKSALTLAELDALPQVQVNANEHGTSHVCVSARGLDADRHRGHGLKD